MANALGTGSKGSSMAGMGTSRPQNTAVSGSPMASRPGSQSAKVPIETSAPMNEHTLGRAPAGWLR